MWFRRNDDEGTEASPPLTPDAATGAAPEPTPADPGGTGLNVDALTRPPAEAAATPPLEVDPAVTAELTPKVVEVLSTIFDPEIPVNIYELGLIYDINASADRDIEIRMTLTAPGCPAAQTLPIQVNERVRALPEVHDVRVEIVWEPPWSKDLMSEAARLQLGIF